MPRSIAGTRLIVVDGHTLRWKCDRRGGSHPAGETWDIRVIAYSCDGGTSRLFANVVPNGELGYLISKESDITPGRVEAIIRGAMTQGWDPSARDPDFYLGDANAILHRLEFPWRYR